MRSLVGLGLLGLLVAPAFAAPPTPVPTDWWPEPAVAADGARIIELKLRRCVIAELEGELLPLRADDAEKCGRLNRATLVTREAGLKRLRLKAGKYLFRIRNLDVAWPIDLALRGAQDLSLPVTKGGSIKAGEVFDFPITLAAGAYLISSPLNGTYDYHLLVEE